MKTDLVFAEYRIVSEKRESYLHFMREVVSRYPETEWYEGTDQPDLFVEVWRGMGKRDYERWKAARLDPRNEEWSPLHAMIPGGTAKLHIWHFSAVRP